MDNSFIWPKNQPKRRGPFSCCCLPNSHCQACFGTPDDHPVDHPESGALFPIKKNQLESGAFFPIKKNQIESGALFPVFGANHPGSPDDSFKSPDDHPEKPNHPVFQDMPAVGGVLGDSATFGKLYNAP